MRFREDDSRFKTKQWRGCYFRRLQRLVWSLNDFLTSTAPQFIAAPIIGCNFIPITRILQKRCKQGTVLAENLEPETRSCNKEYIRPVERLHKRQCRTLPSGATQHSIRLASNTSRNAKPIRRMKYVASFSSNKGLFDHSQREALTVWCTVKASIENRFLLDRVYNARSSMDFALPHIINKHLSVSAF